MSTRRAGIGVLVAMAVLTLSACQTKADCEKTGGRWVTTSSQVPVYEVVNGHLELTGYRTQLDTECVGGTSS